MKYFILLLVVFISVSFGLKKETSFSIEFSPSFGNADLLPQKNYFIASLNDSVSVETFRFYVSAIELIKNSKTIYKEKNSFHLIDLEKKRSIILKPGTTTNFNAIKFHIGIDSLTNVSGVMGGDLDPVNGMYWAWQSGYINLKLEGKSKVCNTRNHVFQYHIGGYQHPFKTLQTVTLPIKNKSGVELIVDLEKLLNKTDLKNTNEVMSPNEKAMAIAAVYKDIFSAR